MESIVEGATLFTLISIILAVGAASLPVVALVTHRAELDWQFIRFTVVCVALPIVAIMAMGGVLTEAAAAIIAGVVGYAFGHSGELPSGVRAPVVPRTPV